MGPNPDFLFLRAWFGLDAPGKLYEFIVRAGIPQFVQGLIGGAGALFLTSRVFRNANLKVVALATAGFYIALTLLSAAIEIQKEGLTILVGAAVCQTIGVSFGLLAMLLDTQKRLAKTAQSVVM